MDVWKWTLAILAVANIKNFPFSWNIRFFWALGSGVLRHRKAKSLLKPSHIFLPAVSTTWAPLMETDFNLHKSNSTYFTDLDVSRAYLCGILFGPLFLSGINGRRCNLIVGNVSCSFRREIRPYQSYETWSKVASFDEKWIYIVTHFVQKDDQKTIQHALQPDDEGLPGEERRKYRKARGDRVIFASAVTQFVCKRGRVTVPPATALAECGLLASPSDRHRAGGSPASAQNSTSMSDSATHKPESPLLSKVDASLPRDLEAFRAANLPAVRLLEGWDRVHDLFQDEELVLGYHHGII